MDCHDDFSSWAAELLSNSAHGAESHKVGWCRFNAHLGDQDCAGGLCDFFVLGGHAEDPWDFSSDVHVVGAILGTRLYAGFAVGGVGADGCEDDGCFAGKVAEFCFVEVADFDGYEEG